MANRLIKPRKFRSSKELKKDLKVPKSDSKENNDPPAPATTPAHPDALDAANSTPSPSQARMTSSAVAAQTSLTARNKLLPELPSSDPPSSPSTRASPGMLSTIRTVPSFEGVISDTSSDAPSVATKNSAFSSSVNSNTSAVSTTSASHTEDDKMSTGRLKPDQSRAWDGNSNGDTLPLPRESMEQGQAVSRPQQPQGQKCETEPTLQPAPFISRTSDGYDAHVTSPISDAQDPQAQGWDSTIGKAGLGKTGRVINKLVSDNEALKRDIQIERLKADEAKQIAKLTEDKMERLIQDYESRLLEANVTKTLLARKERQVESLTATVELERENATAARERERRWREEMDRAKSDAKVKVDEATTRAQLMEGRYNAISSHWKDQGEEVKRTAVKLRSEIATLVEERRRDDEKIVALRELCDQQDGSIKELVRQKEAIAAQFEAYKQAQEDWLRDVKANARAREEEQERILEETRETLAKLKWALNVKQNVPGAQ
ncbi:hypothetical protein VUR80DRAFT_3655 [Thermomyces stellatus]